LEIDPDHPAIAVPRVLALLEFRRVDEAEAALAALDDAAPTDGFRADAQRRTEQLRARLCVANAALVFEANDPSSAEVLYRDCVDAYPSDPLVVLAVVDFYAAVERAEHGLELLRRAFRDSRSKALGWQLTQRARRRADDRARDGWRASLARGGPTPRASGTLAQP
jgi:predicted Zn-dependent protease